jgi:hypothetical protein
MKKMSITLDDRAVTIPINSSSYCEWGRKITVWFRNRSSYGIDRFHSLCRQCWQAKVDRTRRHEEKRQ